MSQAQQKQPDRQSSEWMYEEQKEGPVTRTVYAERHTAFYGDTVFRQTFPETSSSHAVSLKEAREYLDLMEDLARKTADGVGLCILSPALLISLLSLSEQGRAGMTEDLAAGIGITGLFLIIAAAVYQFIQAGVLGKKAEQLVRAPYYRSEEVMSYALQKEQENYLPLSKRLALGIVACILSAAPLILCAAVGAGDGIILAMVTVLLGLVAVGVRNIVYSSTVMGSIASLKKNRMK